MSSSQSTQESSDASMDRLEDSIMEYMQESDEELRNFHDQIYRLNCEALNGEGTSQPQRKKRRYIKRGRVDGGMRLFKDYFDPHPIYHGEMFRRRFRMQRPVFERILAAIHESDPYFHQKKQCTGEMGLTPYQKMTAAIRMLAYGCAGDAVDEYVRIGETTVLKCLRHFCAGVVRCFAGEYLREPNSEDMARLLAENEARGFPGMIGSIDCMHWIWKNCPKAWHGSYVDFKKHPSIVLEGVASYDGWIWHAFFGMPGSFNDINVLNNSSVFDRLLRGELPPVEYVINGTTYCSPYFLGDGIYPKLANIVKTIREPGTPKEKAFATRQESVRKDVERAFGQLQARWGIIRQPARTWNKDLMHKIMVCCIILHNMVCEDERGLPPCNFEAVVEDRAAILTRDNVGRYRHMTEEYAKMRDQRMHNQLRNDLMEHIWNNVGNVAGYDG